MLSDSYGKKGGINRFQKRFILLGVEYDYINNTYSIKITSVGRLFYEIKEKLEVMLTYTYINMIIIIIIILVLLILWSKKID